VDGLRAALDRSQAQQADVVEAAEAALRSYGTPGARALGAGVSQDDALGAALVLAAIDASVSPAPSSSGGYGGRSTTATDVDAAVASAAAEGDVAKEVAALRAVVAAAQAEKTTLDKLRGSTERYIDAELARMRAAVAAAKTEQSRVMTGAKADIVRDGDGKRKASGDMLLAIKQAELDASALERDLLARCAALEKSKAHLENEIASLRGEIDATAEGNRAKADQLRSSSAEVREMPLI